MSEEHGKVTVPTGFIEATIEITLPISRGYLLFVSAFVVVTDTAGNTVEQRSMQIGATQVLPMPPGKFSVRAILGGVTSPPQQVEVKAGEVTPVKIYFGK